MYSIHILETYMHFDVKIFNKDGLEKVWDCGIIQNSNEESDHDKPSTTPELSYHEMFPNMKANARLF
nr:B3 domain-containing protein Os01g0723500-like [Ipomoea batatas]